MTPATVAGADGGIAGYFGIRAQGSSAATEIRAGASTFMVMAYIIFVNPSILGFAGIQGLEGKGLPFAPTLTVTCLTAGLLSIAMGLFSNYPFVVYFSVPLIEAYAR